MKISLTSSTKGTTGVDTAAVPDVVSKDLYSRLSELQESFRLSEQQRRKRREVGRAIVLSQRTRTFSQRSGGRRTQKREGSRYC